MKDSKDSTLAQYMRDNRTMSKKIRRKVLVVPYLKNKLLMVRDIRTGEWGFISGGVKKNESFFRAANRELSEETSNIFQNVGRECTQFTFRTWYRSDEMFECDKKRSEIVESIYTVYIFKLPLLYKSLLSRFVPNNEVDDICIAEFSEMDNVWDFCKDIYDNRLKSRLTNIK